MGEVNKKSATGCLGLIVVFVIIIIASSGGEENQTPEQQANQEKIAQAQLAAQKEKVNTAIDQARKTGLLQKVDSPQRTVYLSPAMWRAVNAETKQDIVNVMAQHMGFINGMDRAVGLTVKDWQSGKIIAEYSIFSGVSIN